MKGFLLNSAKSKGIIGFVMTGLVIFLPEAGFSFTEDDAAFVSDQLDNIIVAGTLLFGAYGRVVAKGPLV